MSIPYVSQLRNQIILAVILSGVMLTVGLIWIMCSIGLVCELNQRNPGPFEPLDMVSSSDGELMAGLVGHLRYVDEPSEKIYGYVGLRLRKVSRRVATNQIVLETNCATLVLNNKETNGAAIHVERIDIELGWPTRQGSTSCSVYSNDKRGYILQAKRHYLSSRLITGKHLCETLDTSLYHLYGETGRKPAVRLMLKQLELEVGRPKGTSLWDGYLWPPEVDKGYE